MSNEIYLGFDPGGNGKFGWAVCQGRDGGVSVIQSGKAHFAADAVDTAVEVAEGFGEIVAAGIDAPMFWVTSGSRRVEQIIRDSLVALGLGSSTGGSVQEINSLAGACLIQGVMAARLLRQRVSNVRITEAHPKALLRLLGLATKNRKPSEVKITDLADFVTTPQENVTDDEKDAILGAYTAWAMVRGLSGWRNIYLDEPEPFPAFDGQVAYWMPL